MNLIISPHADDEVIGTFSFLKDSIVVYVAIDESLVADQDKRHRIGKVGKEKEIRKVMRATAAKEYYILEHKTYNIEFNQLVFDLEQIINLVKPDTVLIPPNTGTNQDHKLVHDACLIALRKHDKIPWVKNVLIYEDLQPINSMKCDYYKFVDVVKKMETFDLYKSQVRKYRNRWTLNVLAIMRAEESNMTSLRGLKYTGCVTMPRPNAIGKWGYLSGFDIYTKEDPFNVKHNKDEITKALLISGLIENKYVLDIGCGEGYFTYFYYSQCGKRHTWGIDISPVAIGRARSTYDLPNLFFDVKDIIEDCMVTEQIFTVIMSEVLYYIKPELWKDVAQKVYDILKEGGQFIISVGQYFTESDIREIFKDKINFDKVYKLPNKKYGYWLIMSGHRV